MKDERRCFLEAKAKFESCAGRVVRLAAKGVDHREPFFVVAVKVEEPGNTRWERDRRSVYPGFAKVRFKVLTKQGQLLPCYIHHVVDFQIVA